MPILRLLLEFSIETPDFPWPRSHQQCCPPCVGLQCLHQRRTVGALGVECFKYSHNPKVRAPKKASIKYRQGNNNIWLNPDFSILANIPRGLWLFSTIYRGLWSQLSTIACILQLFSIQGEVMMKPMSGWTIQSNHQKFKGTTHGEWGFNHRNLGQIGGPAPK